MRVPAPLLQAYNKPVPRYTSYPTSPHFGPMTAETYTQWLADMPRHEPVSLYVHLPFCKSLCYYCGCHMKVVNNPDVIRAYVDAVCAEIALLRAALGGSRVLGQIHLGGGTPSHVPVGSFHKLMEQIRAHFDVAEHAEVAIELDPRTLTPEFAAAMAQHGFNRASLGVQSLNPKTQEAIHRVQPYDMVVQAADWLRAAGVHAINLDLMYGLPYQTVEGMDETVDLVCELNPDRLALFGYAHMPQMRKHQDLVTPHGLPDAQARQDLFCAAAERLIQNGYVAVGMDHFAKPTDTLAIAAKNGTLRRNFQGYTSDPHDTLLGVGVSSIGNLPQGYVQNELDVKPYTADVLAGKLPVRKGRAVTAEDVARREIIQTLMSVGKVDVVAVGGRYGVRAERFEDAFAALKPLVDDGLCDVTETTVTLSQTGWGLVRTVAACFDSYLGKASPATGKVVIHSKAV